MNEAETHLYQREGAYIPRVAAVHDLCGYGKCSLGVAIPVLSAAGCDVCPVPTGLFSSHTAFPGWYMHDTTEILADYLNAWKGIGVEIDAVYSGFLGAPEQVDRIRDLYAMYPNALRVVDPVMADHGKVYPTYTPELCSAMAELACGADILTPNLTEAAIILGEPIGEDWGGTDISDEEAHRLVDALVAKGAKHVVLKGIQREGESCIRNFVGGKDCETSKRITNTCLHVARHGRLVRVMPDGRRDGRSLAAGGRRVRRRLRARRHAGERRTARLQRPRRQLRAAAGQGVRAAVGDARNLSTRCRNGRPLRRNRTFGHDASSKMSSDGVGREGDRPTTFSSSTA